MLLRKLAYSKYLELGVVAHNVNPALGRLRQADLGFKASQSYTDDPVSLTKKAPWRLLFYHV